MSSAQRNYGNDHIFTSRSTDPLINIKPGVGETLLVHGGVTGPLTSLTLGANKFLLGNLSNVAIEVTASGDLTTLTDGTFTLNTVNSTPGSFSLPSLTTNGKGLITSVSEASLTGDISNTLLSTTVNKIKGVPLGSTTSTSGNILIGSGTQWESKSVSGDISIDSLGSTEVNKIKNITLGTINATSGNILIGSGTTLESKSVSGDATIDSTGNVTVSKISTVPITITPITAGRTLVSDGTGFNSKLVTGDMSVNGAGTWSLNDTTVVPGSYSFAGITVDSKGRITSANNGTVTGSALTKTDDTNVTLTLGGSASTALVNAASITAGWTGTLSGTRGGTGVNNGSSTITLGGNLTTSGAFNTTLTSTGLTTVTLPTTGTLISTTTGSALTKTDDTNVTLTLGGSSSTALVNSASITAGWTGQLGLTRGGTNNSLTASNGGIVYSDASKLNILAGTATANQVLLSGSSTTPSWSTATYPSTTTANQVLYSSATNTIGGSSNLTISGSAITAGLPILTGAGTSAAPSHSFSGSTGTGMYSTGSTTTGTLGFSTGSKQGALTISEKGVAVTSTSFVQGYSTTTTAAGTTTLTVDSPKIQFFTGSTTQTVTMPVVSTLTLGQEWFIVNNSSGLVTVQSSGANLMTTIGQYSGIRFFCISLTGTTGASWGWYFNPPSINAGCLTLQNGSASVPAYSFLNNSSVGLYATSSSGTNLLEITTNARHTVFHNFASSYVGMYVNPSAISNTDNTSPDTNGESMAVAANFPATPCGYRQDTTNNHYVMTFRNANGVVGGIRTNGTATAYDVSSDYRLKKDVTEMTDGLSKINSLRPVYYNWISDNKPGEGFISHEFQEIYPLAVYGEKDGVDSKGNPIIQTMDSSFCIASLVSAVKELSSINTQLLARIEALEAKIN